MANSDRFLTVPGAAPRINQPPACPKCGSRQTSSAAKRPSENSYWRCLKCGDVWNPAQLLSRGGRYR